MAASNSQQVFPLYKDAAGTGYASPQLGSSGTDAQGGSNTVQPTASYTYAYNGTTFDRVRSNAAAVLAGTTQSMGMLVASPAEWSVFHTPAVNTQATATKAAGAAGVRHVCRTITATIHGLIAATETTVLINLRDGATGAGTILWQLLLHVIPAGTTGLTLPVNIMGTAATAMTLEFAAAGGANTFESVAMTGYSTI